MSKAADFFGLTPEQLKHPTKGTIGEMMDMLDRAESRGAAAERERCKRLLCPHCKLGKPLQHAASGWRHAVAGVYVPCRAAALQEGGGA